MLTMPQIVRRYEENGKSMVELMIPDWQKDASSQYYAKEMKRIIIQDCKETNRHFLSTPNSTHCDICGRNLA